MQKLIAYDHLEGDPGLEGGKNVPLFTDILNMICNCVDNSSPDRYASVACWLYFLLLCLMLWLFNFFFFFGIDVQYRFASVEGTSYCCGIRQVQRYAIFYCTIGFILYSCGSIVLWSIVHFGMWCRS